MGDLWMKEVVSLHAPVRCPSRSVRWVGQGPLFPFYRWPRRRVWLPLPSLYMTSSVSTQGGFYVNSTISCSPSTGHALFPAHHFISCFLKHHLWRMFWRCDRGEKVVAVFSHVLRVKRRPRKHTWPPALVTVCHYLTVLIPSPIFPP